MKLTNYVPLTCKTYNFLAEKREKNRLHYLTLAVFAATIPIFLTADLFYAAYFKIHNWVYPIYPDCHYHLNSPLFEKYIAQMKDFISQNKALADTQQAQELTGYILETNPKTFKEKLQFHQNIIEKLRSLLLDRKSHFADIFSEWMYAKVDICNEMQAWFKTYVSTSHTAGIKTGDLILGAQRKIAKDSRFRGVHEFPRFYDPHHLGDIPSTLFEIENVKIVRTPAITKDSKRSMTGELLDAEIVPEFKGFLNQYRKDKKMHLYVNLMDRREGSEKIRSSKIEALKDEYSDVLLLITINKDSAFYWQNEGHRDISDAKKFKQDFLFEIFTDFTGWNWPLDFLGEDWKETCAQILENIHLKNFKNKELLELQERLDFIEIAQIRFVEEAIKRLSPQSCNISCRSCIDRGASMLAALYMSNKIRKQEEISLEDQQKIASFALAPALLNQNRAPQNWRVERLATALHRF